MFKKASLQFDDEVAAYVRSYFEQRYLTRSRTLANGRDVRSLFERALANQTNRLVLKRDVTNEHLSRISLSDSRDTEL